MPLKREAGCLGSWKGERERGGKQGEDLALEGTRWPQVHHSVRIFL